MSDSTGLTQKEWSKLIYDKIVSFEEKYETDMVRRDVELDLIKSDVSSRPTRAELYSSFIVLSGLMGLALRFI